MGRFIAMATVCVGLAAVGGAQGSETRTADDAGAEMSNVIVYVDRSTVRAGKLDGLKPAMKELADFVEANEPQIVAYNVYFSPDGSHMSVVHIHTSAASLEEHMRIAGPRFSAVAELIRLEAIDVYGRPGEALLGELREKASALGGGEVSVHELHHGFGRVSGRRADR